MGLPHLFKIVVQTKPKEQHGTRTQRSARSQRTKLRMGSLYEVGQGRPDNEGVQFVLGNFPISCFISFD